jgi:hypothetical protein
MAQNYLVVGVYYPTAATHHQHITKIRIYKPEDDAYYSGAVETAIQQIENKERIYFVNEGKKCTLVNVVNPKNGAKYLRTNGDDSTQDNLMSLARHGD